MPEQTTSAGDRLQHALDGNERYRSRARAVATITATAAGALAAGLVLNVAPGLAIWPRILGLGSIVLLVISTVILVVASLVHPRTFTGGAVSQWRVLLRPWESAYIVEGPQTTQGLLDQSDAIKKRIFTFMDSALWVAGVAMVALVAALTFIGFQQPAKYGVQVEAVGELPHFASCPALTRTFDAVIAKADLERDIAQLPVSVSAESCGQKDKSRVVLFLDRTSIKISMIEAQ